MIKFFRHIRQRLVIENRFSKYLLYAIGEIILVVIGILIALQINNWNEERKQDAIEIGYLKRLVNDLEKDKLLWQNTHDTRKKQVQYIQNTIAINFNKRKDTINFMKLAGDMKTAMTWNSINPNQDTFTELLSSGNLNVIKNDTIKSKLIALNNNYSSIKNWDNTSASTHNRLMETTQSHYNIKDFKPIDPNFAEYVDIQFTEEEIQNAMQSMGQSMLGIINNKEFINNFDVFADNYHRQLPYFKKLEEEVEELTQLITSEINTRQ